ncbi:diketogulonate reductase-like aldo/keto reductase [Halorubrum trapanicum]|uniref:Diketogulonate reductase-like aldo/keto reductase n=2 Tax=Halorubrum trapanicum TaxID=29284 RepID=A0A8J7R8G7_9EURY|nr:diketogulonate reductase-like aldo/keto reductase [Halorubrum trapanicum]
MTDQQQQPAVPTRNGMPVLGLGTWENDDPTQCTESVANALDAGYRHVDTAQIYGNEAAVGKGIAQSDVDREDVFLATKVWIDNLAPADVAASTRESLDKLGVDAVDLLYVHWPAGEYEPEETLPAFAELRDDGLIDRIGVSNFEPHHLDAATDALGEAPFANQVEMHPLLRQEELREYADANDVELVAYSPLARGEILDDPAIVDIAEKHGVSAAQVSLAWLRETGVTAIPKATGVDHIRDNLASLGLELDDEDVEAIDSLGRSDRQLNPDFGPDW